MRRLNRRYETDKFVELKNMKRLRIVIAVLYGLQVFLTSEPFVGDAENTVTAFKMFMLMFRADSTSMFFTCLLFSVLLIFPAVCFFFYCLDRKSNVKSVLSIVCCFVCTYIIVFELNGVFLSGALFTLLVDILILFLSVVLMLATASYNRELKEKESK